MMTKINKEPGLEFLSWLHSMRLPRVADHPSKLPSVDADHRQFASAAPMSQT
jgi:hypothetical protein